jgi:hypothetical protein
MFEKLCFVNIITSEHCSSVINLDYHFIPLKSAAKLSYTGLVEWLKW